MNVFSGSRVVLWGQTDRHDEAKLVFYYQIDAQFLYSVIYVLH
jgi:hypothetical protein